MAVTVVGQLERHIGDRGSFLQKRFRGNDFLIRHILQNRKPCFLFKIVAQIISVHIKFPRNLIQIQLSALPAPDTKSDPGISRPPPSISAPQNLLQCASPS